MSLRIGKPEQPPSSARRQSTAPPIINTSLLRVVVIMGAIDSLRGNDAIGA
jgi:hypothetical protein